jgi:hypothetical protein
VSRPVKAITLDVLQRGADLARRGGLVAPVDAVSLALLERRARSGRSGSGEESVLSGLFETLGVSKGCAVDIAACDGVTNSNSLALFSAGWSGLAVEGDPESFSRLAGVHRKRPAVALARLWVSPDNVVPLLRAFGIPGDFEFLSLDIDGYDHFVLASLLAEFQPRVVCAEINEMVPPPIKFAVCYDPSYRWQGNHFFGQSLSQLYELAEGHGYGLAELHYNNAIFVRDDGGGRSWLTPVEAYESGYLNRPDRLSLFPGNADVEEIHSLDVTGQIAFIEERFAEQVGKYILSV